MLYLLTVVVALLLMMLAMRIGLMDSFDTKEVIFFVLSLAIVTNGMEAAIIAMQSDRTRLRRMLLVSATVSPLIVTSMVVFFSRMT
jgi:hypothetical protein